MSLRELSLFSGAGGGLLGSKLLGWRTVGYVEIDDYCQRVIRQRIRDNILDDAPIFGDIRAFIRDGYAASYSGLVDVVSAGFPCQPFSVSGRRRAHADARNMWPQTAGVIEWVQPSCVLLENVPGLLAPRHGYFGKVLRDLAKLGFDARWGRLSAAGVGAPHLRKRIWIFAYPKGRGTMHVSAGPWRQGQAATDADGMGEALSDANPLLSVSDGARLAQRQGIRSNDESQRASAVGNDWWSAEPAVGRVADEFSNRMDKSRAHENGGLE